MRSVAKLALLTLLTLFAACDDSSTPTPNQTQTGTGSSGAITFAVTPTGTNTTFLPSSAQSVTPGSTQSFTVSVATGVTLSNVVAGTCPGGGWSGNVYTTGVITSNCSVAFNGTINTFALTVGRQNVNVSPSGNPNVNYGATQTFSVTALPGYTALSTVGGNCPAGSWSGTNYTTGSIMSNCSISFSGSINSYSVTLTSANVTVNPNATQTVAYQSTPSFTVSPATNYGINPHVGGTCPEGTWVGETYTTGAIVGNCSLVFQGAQNLLRAQPGNASVSLAWQSTGASSYNLYWSKTYPVNTANAQKISGATSPYVHGGLANGQVYYYALTSVTSQGEGAPSNTVGTVPATFRAIPQNNIQFTSIAGAPAAMYVDGSSVYVGTSNGLSISRDGGATFSTVSAGQGLTGYVNNIYAFGNTVVASVLNNGLFVSRDGGATFISAPYLSGYAVAGISGTGNTIYLAASQSFGEGYVFVTKDLGQTFTTLLNYQFFVNQTRPTGLFVSGSTIGLTTLGAGIYLSTDAGKTFTQRLTATVSDSVFNAFANGNTIFANTWNGVYVSTDLGANFSELSSSNNLSSVSAIYGSGSEVLAATTVGVAYSNDNGSTFSWATGVGATSSLYASQSNIYAITTSGIFRSTDGAKTFSPFALVPPAIPNNVSSVFATSSGIFAVDAEGSSAFATLVSSTDGGVTFQAVNAFKNAPYLFPTIYASGSDLYVADDLGGLYVSKDGGQTASVVNLFGGAFLFFNSIYVSGSNIYIGTQTGLMVSADNGNSFTTYTTANGLGSNNVRQVFVSGPNVYAATDNGISISNAGGQFVNYLANNTTFSVYVDGTTIYAATNGGLFESTNGGSSFTQNNGVTGAMNNVYVSGSTIFVTSWRGTGIYVSTDAGQTFTNYTTVNGLASNSANALAISGSKIYVATGNGLSSN